MARIPTLQPRVALLNSSRATPLASALDYSDPRRGSRHERGYGSAWDRLRKVVLAREDGLCQACLKRTPVHYREATHVDHIVEKIDGGTDDESNLQSLCAPCHHRKTAAEQARRRVGGSPGCLTSVPTAAGANAGGEGANRAGLSSGPAAPSRAGFFPPQPNSAVERRPAEKMEVT